jgi:hypothetical protein
VVALNDQLMQFDQVDWRALQKQDPNRAQALWQVRAQLKDLRNRAARAWTEKEKDHASHSQRATARRVNEVSAKADSGLLFCISKDFAHDLAADAGHAGSGV